MKTTLVFLSLLLIQDNGPLQVVSLDSSSEENVLKDSSIIDNIIQEENNVTPEEKHHYKIKPRPPQYPIEILRQYELIGGLTTKDNSRHTLKSLRVNNTTISKPRDRLFHVWLPVDIIEATDVNRTIARFQQTLPKNDLGNFTSSQITITLRDDAKLNTREYLDMYTICGHDALQHQHLQTKHLVTGKKFYSFAITEFIASCLKYNLTEPYLINISFQVYELHSRGKLNMDFKRLFDVQVDMPLIMYFYEDFIPSETNYTLSTIKQRRSIEKKSTRPLTQCQRRSFVVKPGEVDWDDVLRPIELDLGYCSGTCPFPLEDRYYNFSLHSFLLDRYRLHHMLTAPNGFPQQSICVPITYKPVWILENVGPDRMQAGVVHNLSVETCGCR